MRIPELVCLALLLATLGSSAASLTGCNIGGVSGSNPVAAATAPATLEEVAQSHVDANVPEDAKFEPLLRRDVTVYLQATHSVVVLRQMELLRKGATQSGVAYPKFYLWVVASQKSGEVIEGAVRVAAIEKSQFEVTDFLSAEEILESPASVEQIFPAALAPAIREKAAATRR